MAIKEYDADFIHDHFDEIDRERLRIYKVRAKFAQDTTPDVIFEQAYENIRKKWSGKHGR